nr:hypothetical protein [Bacteroidales bacterium]
LRGSFKLADVPNFSLKQWFDGEFQEALEPAMNDRFGFRNIFVRANNQVGYSIYRKALASGVTIGKENYLYDRNYIKAVNGEDFLGDSIIEENTLKLKSIQDYFIENNKLFFVTFAAGKGSFYPEYFPDLYQGKLSEETNLNTYKKYFEEYGVNYIDFNKWFVEMKDTSNYCLYPRTGIHWSYYGMVLVIDSLVSYLSVETGEVMPKFTWGEVKESRRYRSSDKDIEEGMNIVFRLNHDKMAYPKVSFVDKDVDKLKGVVIADSFYWGIHNIGFSSRIFDQGEYWYYNKQIIANHISPPIELDSIDRMERLRDVDVIIMMATESTLPKFPFGFEKEFD